MTLPPLKTLPQKRARTAAFGGWHAREPVPAGCFADGYGLSAKNYPLLSARPGRGCMAGVYNQRLEELLSPKTVALGADIYDFEHRLINGDAPLDCVLDAYQCGYWRDRRNTRVFQAVMTLPGRNVLGYKPDAPADGDIFVDNLDGSAGDERVFYEYFDTTDTWEVTEAVRYLQIFWQDPPYPAENFKEGDTVTLSGFLHGFDGPHQILGRGPNSLTFDISGEAFPDYWGDLNGTVSRIAPAMDFVTAMGNRVWGCSSAKHEIYGSKLGDPLNWQAYSGLSDDSYAATVGSAGDFTGIAADGDSVLFFKEDRVHRLTGTAPSNFQLIEMAVPGIEEGSAASAAPSDGTIYYKGPGGVYAWQGGNISLLSDSFDASNYHSAVAGVSGDTLYISMQGLPPPPSEAPPSQREAVGFFELFSYHIPTRTWHREGPVHMAAAAVYDGDLYYRDGDDGEIYAIGRGGRLPAGAAAEGAVPWMAETWDLGAAGSGLNLSPDRWRLQRLSLRVFLPPGSTFEAEVQYDKSGVWQGLAKLRGTGKKHGLLDVPLQPRRCATLRLRLKGRGEFHLYEIAETYQQES